MALVINDMQGSHWKLPAELRILEAFGQGGGGKSPSRAGLTIAELKESTGVPHTSLNRAIRLLLQAGYLHRVRRGAYVLGASASALASRLFESTVASRFSQVLEDLRDRTGLNSELYSISPSGPLLVKWVGGISMFNVRMYPGHQIQSANNPAGLVFYARFPGARMWGREVMSHFADGSSLQSALEEYRRTGFYFESGRILPELARAVFRSRDEDFCFGVSGLISEFPKDIAILKRQIQEVMDENDFSDDGFAEQALPEKL